MRLRPVQIASDIRRQTARYAKVNSRSRPSPLASEPIPHRPLSAEQTRRMPQRREQPQPPVTPVFQASNRWILAYVGLDPGVRTNLEVRKIGQDPSPERPQLPRRTMDFLQPKQFLRGPEVTATCPLPASRCWPTGDRQGRTFCRRHLFQLTCRSRSARSSLTAAEIACIEAASELIFTNIRIHGA
jgi:hypothetical protein